MSLYVNKAGKPWTKDEGDKLIELYDAGRTVAQLAADFGRSNGAIASRIRLIEEGGMTTPAPRKGGWSWSKQEDAKLLESFN